MMIPTQVTALGFIKLVTKMGLMDSFIPLIVPTIASPVVFFYMKQAARLVKGVIDMALGPAASGVLVEPMRNYPPSGKMPLIISVAGVQQHLFWFYPQQPFEEMCETLSAMLNEIPVTGDSVPA